MSDKKKKKKNAWWSRIAVFKIYMKIKSESNSYKRVFSSD